MKNVSSRTSSLKMRLMSALTSIMTLLTVAVPSMTTTVSATDLTSLSGKPTTDVELLAGEGNILAEGASNASDVISNADRTYLIGIASQFCVFLHDDFTVKMQMRRDVLQSAVISHLKMDGIIKLDLVILRPVHRLKN